MDQYHNMWIWIKRVRSRSLNQPIKNLLDRTSGARTYYTFCYIYSVPLCNQRRSIPGISHYTRERPMLVFVGGSIEPAKRRSTVIPRPHLRLDCDAKRFKCQTHVGQDLWLGGSPPKGALLVPSNSIFKRMRLPMVSSVSQT